MRIEVRTLVERASRWLVNNRRQPLDSEATVAEFEVVVEKVMAELPELMSGRELEAFTSRRDALVGRGVPEELATRVAVCPPAYMVLGIVQTAARMGIDPMIRLKYQGHEFYESAERFADEWDQKAFDPDYPTLPLEHFEPMVREVFGRPPKRDR